MAKGPEIYRKIEDAVLCANWAEVSRLAKKYRRRGDLSEAWEAVLEALACFERARGRVEEGEPVRVDKDTVDHLELPGISDDGVLREAFAAVSGVKGTAAPQLLMMRGVLSSATRQYQSALSLLNTLNMSEVIAHGSELQYGWEEGLPPRYTNNAQEMPVVLWAVAVLTQYWKGIAAEGLYDPSAAITIYKSVLSGVALPDTPDSAFKFQFIKGVVGECRYRQAMLLMRVKLWREAGLACKMALTMDRKDGAAGQLGAVRRLSLLQSWLDVMPRLYRRGTLRVELDVMPRDCAVSEGLEEERVWVCREMWAALDEVAVLEGNKLEVSRLLAYSRSVIQTFSLIGAFPETVDFIKSFMFAHLPISASTYAALFLGLIGWGRVSEAYLAGRILVNKYGEGEVEDPVLLAYLKDCCYRLGLVEEVIGWSDRLEGMVGGGGRVLLGKALLVHSRVLSEHERIGGVQRALSLMENVCVFDDTMVPESHHIASICHLQLGDLERAFTSVGRALQASPGTQRYAVWLGLLHSARKDYRACLRVLEGEWGAAAVHSLDLVIAKARTERLLGAWEAAQETLRSGLSATISEAAVTVVSSSDNYRGLSDTASRQRAATMASAVSVTSTGSVMGDARLASFLSEPALDLLESKKAPPDAGKSTGTFPAEADWQAAFPKDIVEWRVERLEGLIAIPSTILPARARLGRCEGEGYGEFRLLTELADLYLSVPGQEAELEYCLQCLARLDQLHPRLHALQGHQLSVSPSASFRLALDAYERCMAYGGDVEGVLGVARLNLVDNAAYSKILLSRLLPAHQDDHRVLQCLGQACQQLGQAEDAGGWFERAMEVESRSVIYKFVLY